MMIDLSAPVQQATLAQIVGVSKQAINAMVQDGKLPDCKTMGEMLSAYCERLRGQAAGRLGSESEGGLDLVQERAGLAQAQRIAQELKNAVSTGEYAPIGLLSDVLGMASSAVADRLGHLEGALRKSCPGIDDEVMAVVLRVVTSARNEWIRSTSKLVVDAIDAMKDDGDCEFLITTPSDEDAP